MSNNETIRKYNANGNLIYLKTSGGYEAWFEYDTNNNQIYYKNSDGFEYWCEYDANNNMIHYKNSEGVDEWYDSDGNVIDKPTEKKDNNIMIATMKHGLNDKLFILKVSCTDTNTDDVSYVYESIFANDWEQAVDILMEELDIEEDWMEIKVEEVYSTTCVKVFEKEDDHH